MSNEQLEELRARAMIRFSVMEVGVTIGHLQSFETELQAEIWLLKNLKNHTVLTIVKTYV